MRFTLTIQEKPTVEFESAEELRRYLATHQPEPCESGFNQWIELPEGCYPSRVTIMRDEHKPVVDAINKGVHSIENALREQTKAVVSAITNSKPKQKGVTFGWSVGQPTAKNERVNMLELSITNEQEVIVTLKPVTETGKPAKIDGAASFTILSGSSQVKPSDDGLSATLVSSDDPGDTEIMVKADVDLTPNQPDGSGIEEISDIIRLHVLGAKASSLGLSAGTPTPKAT